MGGFRSTYLTRRSLIKGLPLNYVVYTMHDDVAEIHFHWDERKHAENKRKLIRIISARRANRSERAAYYRRWKKVEKNFKALAAQNGVPYQTLINLYLRDCATSGKKLVFR